MQLCASFWTGSEGCGSDQATAAARMGNALTCLVPCLHLPSPHYYARSARPGLPASLLDDGTRIIVRGLQSSAMHNGKEGVVLSFEAEASRYLVSLPDGTTISVRGANLLQSIGVTIVDTADRGDLNGRSGRIVGGDEQRYHVSVQGQVVALTPSNVLLPRGARVRIEGLQQTPQYNGAIGVVVDVDHDARRYVVQMATDGSHNLRVRWDNCRL